MLKPIIEICSSNIRHGTYKFITELEESNRYDVIQYGCLGNCGQCYAEAYAYVEGDIISGETLLLFEQHMKQKLQEIENIDQDENDMNNENDGNEEIKK
jgi:uncharacterized protein YuzB (UPF0349 family)